MLRLKLFLIFIILLTIPSYFLLQGKDFNIPSLNLGKKEAKVHSSDQKGEVIITETELEELISKNAKIFSKTDASFSEAGITLTGSITSPIEGELNSLMNPKVEKEKLILEINELKVGGIKSPDILANQIQSVLQKVIDKNVNKHVKIKSVIIRNNEIVLITK